VQNRPGVEHPHVERIEALRLERPFTLRRDLDAPARRAFECRERATVAVGERGAVRARDRQGPGDLVGARGTAADLDRSDRLVEKRVERRVRPGVRQGALPRRRQPVQQHGLGVPRFVRALANVLGQEPVRGDLRIRAQGERLDVAGQPFAELARPLVRARLAGESAEALGASAQERLRPAELAHRVRSGDGAAESPPLQPPKLQEPRGSEGIRKEIHLVRRPLGVGARLIRVERLVEQPRGRAGRIPVVRLRDDAGDRRAHPRQIDIGVGAHPREQRVGHRRAVAAPHRRERLGRRGVAHQVGMIIIIEDERDVGRDEPGPGHAGGRFVVGLEHVPDRIGPGVRAGAGQDRQGERRR